MTEVRDAFVWGSITKTLTGASILRLVETGAVTLDAPIQAYLDPFFVRTPLLFALCLLQCISQGVSESVQVCGGATRNKPCPPAVDKVALLDPLLSVQFRQ